MKKTLVPCVLISLAAAVLSGCGDRRVDRTDEQADRQATAALPTPALPPGVDGGTGAPQAPGQGTPAPVTGSAPEIPAELAASDAAYEAWFRKYQLNLNDPNMLDADPDKDGISNRDEFLADTNPTDPNSLPGIHKSIRLKEYNEVRLPVILEGVEGGTARIKRLEDGGNAVEKVKAGESIKGLPYRVAKVEGRMETDKHGEKVDVSTVVLNDPNTQEQVVLVKDLPAKTAATHAVLTSPDGQTTIKVREGETFSWPAEPQSQYRVVDLRDDQVVVQEVATRKTWTIQKQ